jgi:hypothetical protein
VEKYYFFDSNADIGDRRLYSAADWSKVLSKFLENGIYSEGDNLSVSADGSGMTLTVGSGVAFINGHMYENDGTLTLNVDAAEATLDRIDLVVLRLDLTEQNRYIRSFVVKGVPGANPVAPIPQETTFIKEVPLAEVRVTAAKSTIDQVQITDKRSTDFVEPFVDGSRLTVLEEEVIEVNKQSTVLNLGSNAIVVKNNAALKINGMVGKTDVVNLKGIFGIKNPTIEANGKREVVETTLHSLYGLQDELIRDIDGKLKKLARFREVELNGSRLYGPGVTGLVGYKEVSTSVSSSEYAVYQGEVAKYDGKILYNRREVDKSNGDQQALHANGNLYITILNIDSGWGDNYQPTADEIKAYFYGWRMRDGIGNVYSGTGTKYWSTIASGGMSTALSTLPTYEAPRVDPESRKCRQAVRLCWKRGITWLY